MVEANWGDIYKELGATPVINATGSLTLLGGSVPVPEVKEAMERAEGAYIHLMDLEEKAGAAIAHMLDVPEAYITSGAGSALTLAAAAFMAGDDDARIQRFPNTDGMKNEILIQARQRYWYDRRLEMAGAKLVDFGSADETTPENLENSIGPDTAAVHYNAVVHPDPHALSLEQTIEIAHSHGVPVMVDSAGQIYPLGLFGRFVRQGADFQCIATKYLGAFQSTGLALGTEETIHEISHQSFVGYEGRRIRGIGRPQKVDRQEQEVVGVVAAVKRWINLNHEERLATAEEQSRAIIAPLRGIPGVSAQLITNVIGHHPFGVQLNVDPAVTGMTLQDVVAKLKEGDPPVWTRVRAGEDFIIMHVFGLMKGQDTIVGERIAALFS